MPSINIKQDLYNQIQQVMAVELKEKLKSANPKQAMLDIVRNKFGVTFSSIIKKMLDEYKKNHKIK